MKFRPFDKKIEEVFGGKNRYEIPNFQRDYSWDKKNYTDFMNDLLESCKATIDNNSFNIELEENEYFFGTLLVVGDSSSPNIKAPYIVVDGQQRLTTMTLFYAAILNLIKVKDENYATDFEVKLLFKDTNEGKQSEYARLVNKTLEPILPVNILNLNNKKINGAKHEPQNSSQNWLLESYKIIYNMLEKDSLFNQLKKNNTSSSADISDSNYISFLDNFGKFLSKATVIIIFSEELESANIIYRNFNYRGKPLSQPDLIKNEIFSILEDDSGSVLSSWKEIEKNIYLTDEKLSTFFYHYMIGNFTNTTKNNLFEIFLENEKPDEKTYLEFINKLKLNSEFYKEIIKPSDSSKVFGIEYFFKQDSNPSIMRDLIFLNSIEVVQTRILLLSIFEAMNSKKISSKIFRKVINIIAKHQCLHVLTKSPSNKLTPIYKTYSKKFRGSKDQDFNKIISNLISELNKKLPDKDLVIKEDLFYDHNKKLKSMQSAEKKNRALIKYILSTISVDIQSENSERGNDGLAFIYNATLEHIIDQENDIKNVKSIGNIILLEQDLHKNSKGSENKKIVYSKSKITLTNSFWEKYPKYDENYIMKRKNSILSEYYDIITKLQ